MNEIDFQGLLQGVRELNAALKGDKSVIARVDRIELEGGVMECGDLSPLWTAGLVTPPSAAAGSLRADKSARPKR